MITQMSSTHISLKLLINGVLNVINQLYSITISIIQTAPCKDYIRDNILTHSRGAAGIAGSDLLSVPRRAFNNALPLNNATL